MLLAGGIALVVNSDNGSDVESTGELARALKRTSLYGPRGECRGSVQLSGKAHVVDKSKPFLRVSVIRANDLAIGDHNGLSDPFVSLSIRDDKGARVGEKKHTQVIHKTLNPVWNETFVWLVDDTMKNLKGHELLLHVWDQDFDANDFLGSHELALGFDIQDQGIVHELTLTLTEMDHHQKKENKFKIKFGSKPKIEIAGTVTIEIELVTHDYLITSHFGKAVTDSSLAKQQIPEYESPIPSVLILIRKAMELASEKDQKTAFEQDGIFRIACLEQTLTVTKRQLNIGQFDTNVAHDPHVLANLIKQWFRECPVRILDEHNHGNKDKDRIAECVKLDENGPMAAGEVVKAMNEPMKSLFLWLLDLCVQVVKTKKDNRMDERNMGVVIGPNMIAKASEITRDETNHDVIQAYADACKESNQFFMLCLLWRQQQS